MKNKFKLDGSIKCQGGIHAIFSGIRQYGPLFLLLVMSMVCLLLSSLSSGNYVVKLLLMLAVLAFGLVSYGLTQQQRYLFIGTCLLLGASAITQSPSTPTAYFTVLCFTFFLSLIAFLWDGPYTKSADVFQMMSRTLITLLLWLLVSLLSLMLETFHQFCFAAVVMIALFGLGGIWGRLFHQQTVSASGRIVVLTFCFLLFILYWGHPVKQSAFPSVHASSHAEVISS